jgi:hypothetical protein
MLRKTKSRVRRLLGAVSLAFAAAAMLAAAAAAVDRPDDRAGMRGGGRLFSGPLHFGSVGASADGREGNNVALGAGATLGVGLLAGLALVVRQRDRVRLP